MNNPKDYWQDKTNSGHRFSSTEYFRKKALECVQIIEEFGSEGEIIDLGCGAGELLEQLIPLIKISKGIDYSASMIESARKRLEGIDIDLDVADVFETLPQSSFPIWTTTEALNQYLNATEMARIIKIFARNEKAHAFYLFDCVDPIRYLTLGMGSYYSSQPEPVVNGLTVRAKSIVRDLISCAKLANFRVGRHQWIKWKDQGMGFAYTPYFWFETCKRLNLEVSFISSKYYEYRYHAIIRKPPSKY
ncbi:class I SAM-dependent methyltransferase [Pseudomonas chlororaphis]|uniref:class I SAM-dependent methyltransferase n=1 Tax=Pseudomonas chlororaphis TaxID=587753 RepID=UPI00209B08AD|nr:class I SAM-dependent methyltransferase [Pseudomonas chlororaphis]MCO7570707.1 class I SAM-dependent methyltransferase [Pseudomonas chlororaphis]MCO7588773.1 class I SAM-dependent methyltransferase [Pseudomonas chlororaphis]MCO7611922.1 class I SAM-dependent methyltransferase [Pseudomonas chlororaphis]